MMMAGVIFCRLSLICSTCVNTSVALVKTQYADGFSTVERRLAY